MHEKENISNIYLWFDTEFSSLQVEEAELLQVAIVATDHNLNRITPEFEDINLFARIGSDTCISPWVQENLPHLVECCRSNLAIPVADIDRQIGIWLERHFGSKREDISDRPVISGNSLCCDWYLARKFLPALSEFTNYRLLDVSGWKVHWNNAGWGAEFDKDNPELVRKYSPSKIIGETQQHDAYFDVQASIAEFNYYSSMLSPNQD